MSNRCEADTTPFRHRMPAQIRFNDIDMLGHLNNSVYFTFMDLAKTRYFQEVLGKDLEWSKIGVVIVNVNCDFCIPTFFNDDIEVETAVTSIGEKSLMLEQRVVCPTDHSVRCRCRTVMAGYDTDTLTSVPITDRWRQALEAYEGRCLDRDRS